MGRHRLEGSAWTYPVLAATATATRTVDRRLVVQVAANRHAACRKPHIPKLTNRAHACEPVTVARHAAT